MRIKTGWRNWKVSTTQKVEWDSQYAPKSGNGEPLPDNPPKEKPKPKKRKPLESPQGIPKPKLISKDNDEVKEIPFYDMPESDRDLIDRTDYPGMLSWSKESGLNRGMVDIANDMNDVVSRRGNRFRRLGNSVNVMISKFAEDQCGNDIFPGNEFWDEDALLNRVMTKVPIHICRKDRELEKVVLILDTSPSCSEQALLYANIARAVVGQGLVEMYDAPNAYITRKFCPVKKKFVEFMDRDSLLKENIAKWKIFHNRHIIFFGDTDGWRIVYESMQNNKVHWFMNLPGDQWEDYISGSKNYALERLPKQVRQRIYTNIYNTGDFIDAIKRLK